MSTTEQVPLFVFGASGMLAGELVRLASAHPRLALAGLVSREPGSLAAQHPHWPDEQVSLDAERATAEIARALDARGRAACVLALPHGASCAAWLALRRALGGAAERLALVDLAADFRLRDPDRYARAYGHAHPAPEELAGFVYALPELGARAALRTGKRAAAPGCFATALQLAVVPAARAGLLDATRPWVLHGVTGSSGSGAEPTPGTHHPHRHGNLWAYALDGHRHEAELEQALEPLGLAPALHFVPHSGPFARGIHLTAALPLARGVSDADARRAYHDAYAGEPFVALSGGRAPDLRAVAGSNRALVLTRVRGEVLTVLCTLDNLVKGGAGQALQALNLMLGFDEALGLPRVGLGVA